MGQNKSVLGLASIRHNRGLSLEQISQSMAEMPQGFTPHPFSVNKTGEISIKITALAPLNNVPLGIIWAQAASDGSCVSVIQSGIGNLNFQAIVGQIFEPSRGEVGQRRRERGD